MEIKNLNTEILWPNHLVNKHKQGIIEEENAIYPPGPTRVNNINEDQIMFSDDTGIPLRNTDDIIHELQIYDQVKENNQ